MGFKNDRHVTGFAGPGDGGFREGYRPEGDGLAQAKYAASFGKKPASGTKARLGRIGRVLRRLLWEF